jgi:hypothetical protein
MASTRRFASAGFSLTISIGYPSAHTETTCNFSNNRWVAQVMQWRAQAIARMDRDPQVFDELCSVYPD